MARYGMLIDLRRCAGCYACVVACQLWNNQRPGTAWGHVERREWTDEAGQAKRCYLPHACMHCSDAPCEAACPTGATYTREDGIVLVDYEKCIGCGACVSACPWGARSLATNDSWWFDAEEPAPYESEGIVRETPVAEKCVFCAPRLEQGMQPACVVNCPGKDRIFGDLDDPESDISVALAEAGDAAINIPSSSFYYIAPEGMPSELLPVAFGEWAHAAAGTQAEADEAPAETDAAADEAATAEETN